MNKHIFLFLRGSHEQKLEACIVHWVPNEQQTRMFMESHEQQIKACICVRGDPHEKNTRMKNTCSEFLNRTAGDVHLAVLVVMP